MKSITSQREANNENILSATTTEAVATDVHWDPSMISGSGQKVSRRVH